MRKGIIDIHAHVLPGVDDGARDMEEACSLLGAAAAQGVTGVIATPHYSGKERLEELQKTAETLQGAVRKIYPDFCVYVGMENYGHEELPERLKEGRALTLAGSRYVLVEYSTGAAYRTIIEGMRKLSFGGYEPVLAHMERYQCLRDEKKLSDLAGSGYWLQMNYESLEGAWFSRETRWCRRQVEQGRIALLGTDMHRLDWRAPRLEGALKWLEGHVSQRYLEDMIWNNPLKILGGEEELWNHPARPLGSRKSGNEK